MPQVMNDQQMPIAIPKAIQKNKESTIKKANKIISKIIREKLRLRLATWKAHNKDQQHEKDPPKLTAVKNEEVKNEGKEVTKDGDMNETRKKGPEKEVKEVDRKKSDDEERQEQNREVPKKDAANIDSRAANVNVVNCSANAKLEVEKWVRRALDKGVDGLREEFMSLRRYVPANMTCTAFQGTYESGKSRFKDVPCQDQHGVVLKWPGAVEDYIHANYVGTPISKKRFICTQNSSAMRQGPMPKSVIDFWHMVMQEESDSIIMLTNLIEKGLNKCEAYWPDEQGTKAIWGDVEIQNISVRAALTPEEQCIRLCVLIVKWQQDGQKRMREVRHYRWMDWPDRGVPLCRLTSMVLLSHVRGSKKPVVVHCSAGIGRTGAIVAMEFIIERLQTDIACESMDQILKDLRDQRPFSIQNDLKHRIGANAEGMSEKYKRFVEEYDKATSSQ